jgi:hypothetical protein
MSVQALSRGSQHSSSILHRVGLYAGRVGTVQVRYQVVALLIVTTILAVFGGNLPSDNRIWYHFDMSPFPSSDCLIVEVLQHFCTFTAFLF